MFGVPFRAEAEGKNFNGAFYGTGPTRTSIHARSGTLVFAVCRSHRHLLKAHGKLYVHSRFSTTTVYLGVKESPNEAGKTKVQIFHRRTTYLNSFSRVKRLPNNLLEQLFKSQRLTGSVVYFPACSPATTLLPPHVENHSVLLDLSYHFRTTTCWYHSVHA